MEQSLFMAGGGGRRESIMHPKEHFTPPFAFVKFSLPHQRKTGEKFTPPVNYFALKCANNLFTARNTCILQIYLVKSHGMRGF